MKLVQGITLDNTILYLLILLLGSSGEALSQRYFSVVFDQLPKDMQLYARDNNNMAEVPISGVIELPGWNYFSVVTYRNKVKVGYTRSVLNYQGGSVGHFSTSSRIKAEIADYDFEVYASKSEGDSILVVRKSEIVAGDFFLISGQSNAAATIFGDWSSKYCRTLGRYPDESSAIGRGDTLWIPSAWSWTYVGAWGLEIQRSILENEGIPTCVINGSLPGAKLSDFLVRDDNNPASLTLYGLLLHKVRVAKPKRIRAFFWAHGEQEVFENIDGYAEEYEQLFKFWQKDYPMVEKFVVVQSNIIVLDNGVPNPVNGSVRDFLRRTKYLFPKTDHFAAVAVPGYDGVHYDRPGYEELGRRLFRFLRPELYNSSDIDNVQCPDIKRAFYSNAEKTEITLTFDEGQILTWPMDTTITGQDGNPLIMSLKNFFYLDSDETNLKVTSGRVDKNRVILSLKEPVNAWRMSYLPSFIPKNLPLIVPFSYKIGRFNGPYLINKRGLGAFSFHNVTINEGLIPITLQTIKTDFNTVNLSWKKNELAAGYILEKKLKGTADFLTIKYFDPSQLSYEDKDVSNTSAYIYRIKAFNSISETAYAISEIDLSPILAVEPGIKNRFLKTYPNPVTDFLKIDFSENFTGTLQVFNIRGQEYYLSEIKATKSFEFNTSFWPKGSYIVNLKNDLGIVVSKTIVKQ
ncbi:T9SS type A sorting domain-containing protein [Dyadobacter frigoris]|uniref:T9SS type A sorting domain-containing protein n=2 Tax=Dyadobacter frigoris TaxID=2576211 RepID=A0A4U6D6K8_9BACT|nr:T9SS type A sorting domain-containing protein [Dyadobacter frigoris]